MIDRLMINDPQKWSYGRFWKSRTAKIWRKIWYATIAMTLGCTSYKGTAIYIPPEFYNLGSYSALPAMTWSIGCLAYVFLNGDSPFSTRKEVSDHTCLEFINDQLDQATKEFLEDLLTVDEEYRMTPGEIVFHPWMNWMWKDSACIVFFCL